MLRVWYRVIREKRKNRKPACKITAIYSGGKPKNRTIESWNGVRKVNYYKSKAKAERIKDEWLYDYWSVKRDKQGNEKAY